MIKDKRERIAEIQHDIWVHWMKYLYSVSDENSDGCRVIPARFAKQWQRKMGPYSSLTHAEQESDRHQADKVLALL